ncbi:MAG: dTDP-4-dehydrorhamnose reductase [Sediminibacterium sp.]|nr:dTDP-4-dehydrorhamnose reductase [Sediminibacterium sp.]
MKHPDKIILVLGNTGQVGIYVQKLLTELKGYQILFWDRSNFDFLKQDSILKIIKVKPHIIINTVAYTQVDLAETEIEKAHFINGYMVGEIAKCAQACLAMFIHISTDYVFDGSSQIPYTENVPTAPLNIYGISKLEGEMLALKYNPESIIIRTSWVYSPFNKNFLLTMLFQFTVRKELRIINDQLGCPTFAKHIAEAIITIAQDKRPLKKISGIYHFQNSGGPVSWYDFAKKIKDLSKATPQLIPITTAQYNSPTPRPLYSVLNCTKIGNTFPNIKSIQWEDALVECFAELEPSID